MKKVKLITIFKVVSILIISSIWLFFLFIVLLCLSWLYGPIPERNFDQFEDSCKKIRFENRLDSTNVLIKIHIAYTGPDSLSSLQDPIDSHHLSSKLDSMVLAYHSYREGSFSVPISKRDSMAFPEDFSIKIYDRDTRKLLQVLDLDAFMIHAEPEYMANKANFLTAKQWKLVIDRTLLNWNK